VTASLKGWIYCCDNAEECADIVTASGSKLGKSHQLWMMNEVNKIVWPSPADGSYTTQYAEAADQSLEADGLNVTGDAFTPITVTLNEGGK
jgi:NitT/TauT family transport system substrate-binding protein